MEYISYFIVITTPLFSNDNLGYIFPFFYKSITRDSYHIIFGNDFTMPSAHHSSLPMLTLDPPPPPPGSHFNPFHSQNAHSLPVQLLSRPPSYQFLPPHPTPHPSSLTIARDTSTPCQQPTQRERRREKARPTNCWLPSRLLPKINSPYGPPGICARTLPATPSSRVSTSGPISPRLNGHFSTVSSPSLSGQARNLLI